MSDYSAIRGVTETLRVLLEKQMETAAKTVSSGPPDLDPKNKEKRVNLYLYKVQENPYLRNQEIPGMGSPGAYGHPPLSIVLHYLLTAFPKDETEQEVYDLEAHEILGDAMRVFHDYPILTDSMEVPPGSGTKLLRSSLQNQFEKLKIVLEPLDTEELTKIWMGLSKPYRLSVGYAVSVVQIESRKPRRVAPPVKKRRLHTMGLKRPRIDGLSVSPSGGAIEMPPATARVGDTVELKGANLSGLSTEVVIGDKAFVVAPESGGLVRFTVADDPALQPGPTSVGVRVKTAAEVVVGGYDDPGEVQASEGVESSNEYALMLAPKVTGANPATGDSTVVLTIDGERLYKEGLRTLVLVGDASIELREPEPGDAWAGPTATSIQVPLNSLAGLPAGRYPLRVRVNGAESLEEMEFELT